MTYYTCPKCGHSSGNTRAAAARHVRGCDA